MPSLENIQSRILRNTRYLVSNDDIFSALNEAGFLIYTRILKEGQGFFVKTDETTVVLTPGTQEYSLPADCSQLAHVAERSSPTEQWYRMSPESQNMALESLNTIYNGWIYDGQYGQDSRFSYYGPYLDQSSIGNALVDSDNSLQVQKMRISPLIDQTRAVQLLYTAKWLPIYDGATSMTLPEEGTHGLYNLAMADLLSSIDDSRAQSFAAMAETSIRGFLTWVRDRQLQTGPKVEMYLL